jgi:hypothetical protein
MRTSRGTNSWHATISTRHVSRNWKRSSRSTRQTQAEPSQAASTSHVALPRGVLYAVLPH